MYRVLWLRRAEEALARHWINADSLLRKSITEASHKVDLRLKNDPLNQSESRVDITRVLFEAPLTVYYAVHEPTMTVVVLKVRVYRKRKK